MTTSLHCYNCGADLSRLTLPLSRRDLCPDCSVDLHVCRMCESFDPGVLRQCREDDAEEVLDKRKVNFCEWFVPSSAAWDPSKTSGDAAARAALSSLFGEGDGTGKADDDDDARSAAEKLFD